MALLIVVLEVFAVLGGMAALLWFSAAMESRHLGPVQLDQELEVAGQEELSAVA